MSKTQTIRVPRVPYFQIVIPEGMVGWQSYNGRCMDRPNFCGLVDKIAASNPAAAKAVVKASKKIESMYSFVATQTPEQLRAISPYTNPMPEGDES